MLVKSEGGNAEEIIDEENGILISTILRQYFMGLRTVGQWKNLADRWVSVAENTPTPLSPSVTTKAPSDDWLQSKGPTRNPIERTRSEETSKEWTDFLQSRIGLNKAPLDDDSDTESEEGDPDDVDDDQMDFEILLMRKFWTRWALRTGVKSSVCDALREEECTVDWTRTIAPVLEGRVKLVQS